MGDGLEKGVKKAQGPSSSLDASSPSINKPVGEMSEDAALREIGELRGAQEMIQTRESPGYARLYSFATRHVSENVRREAGKLVGKIDERLPSETTGGAPEIRTAETELTPQEEAEARARFIEGEVSREKAEAQRNMDEIARNIAEASRLDAAGLRERLPFYANTLEPLKRSGNLEVRSAAGSALSLIEGRIRKLEQPPGELRAPGEKIRAEDIKWGDDTDIQPDKAPDTPTEPPEEKRGEEKQDIDDILSKLSGPSLTGAYGTVPEPAKIERKGGWLERVTELRGKLSKRENALEKEVGELERDGKITKGAFRRLGEKYNELSRSVKMGIGIGLAAVAFAIGGSVFDAVPRNVAELFSTERTVTTPRPEIRPAEKPPIAVKRPAEAAPAGARSEQTPARVTLPEYTAVKDDNLTKIIRENFPEIKNLPSGRQENAIENVVSQIIKDPESFGITSGKVAKIEVGDKINLQKIKDIIESYKIGGKSIVEHAKGLSAETVDSIRSFISPRTGI